MHSAAFTQAPGKRRVLFLQGCTSPFFAQLSDQLRASGHQIYRINFNAGDAAYWGRRPAWNFRDPVAALPEYLEHKFSTIGFSDVIMLGDTRPVHLPVLPIAARYGARIHVLEEGYFRPNWLTLEEEGINGHSRLPKDPDWYRDVGKMLPDVRDGEPVANPIRLLMPYYERRDNKAIDHLLRSGDPYYLLPLQLNSDSQIQTHSSSRGIPFMIKDVINSFFRHAPGNAHLVIKNHPLDPGFIDYAHWIKRLQRRLKIEGRILYLESGHLPTLLQSTLGVVTVNSSVGTSALLHGCPTIALGNANYDIPGLTFQGTLDAFWNNLERPDKQLFKNFRKTVIHTSQINGGFYSRAGIKMGVSNCSRRFELAQSPLDALLAKTHGAA